MSVYTYKAYTPLGRRRAARPGGIADPTAGQESTPVSRAARPGGIADPNTASQLEAAATNAGNSAQASTVTMPKSQPYKYSLYQSPGGSASRRTTNAGPSTPAGPVGVTSTQAAGPPPSSAPTGRAMSTSTSSTVRSSPMDTENKYPDAADLRIALENLVNDSDLAKQHCSGVPDAVLSFLNVFYQAMADLEDQAGFPEWVYENVDPVLKAHHDALDSAKAITHPSNLARYGAYEQLSVLENIHRTQLPIYNLYMNHMRAMRGTDAPRLGRQLWEAGWRLSAAILAWRNAAGPLQEAEFPAGEGF